MDELAKRAVKCNGFRWMPGMRCFTGSNKVAIRIVSDDFAPLEGNEIPLGLEGRAPDLEDPATLGCLLALVREAWGDPLILVDYNPHMYTSEWTVLTPYRDKDNRAFLIAGGDTEAEALVAALEAAGGK